MDLLVKINVGGFLDIALELNNSRSNQFWKVDGQAEAGVVFY
jgi:hypothetical protein